MQNKQFDSFIVINNSLFVFIAINKTWSRDEELGVDWFIRSKEAWAGVPRAGSVNGDSLNSSRAKFNQNWDTEGAVAGGNLLREWRVHCRSFANRYTTNWAVEQLSVWR